MALVGAVTEASSGLRSGSLGCTTARLGPLGSIIVGEKAAMDFYGRFSQRVENIRGPSPGLVRKLGLRNGLKIGEVTCLCSLGPVPAPF